MIIKALMQEPFCMKAFLDQHFLLFLPCAYIEDPIFLYHEQYVKLPRHKHILDTVCRLHCLIFLSSQI